MTEATAASPAARIRRALLPRAAASVVALLVLAVIPAAAQEAGPRIVEVEVEGTVTLDPARVRALSGLSVGTTLTPRATQQAIRALWQTDLFNDVAIDTRSAPGGAIATIRVEEAPVVTAVEIEGADEVSEDDVVERLGLRRGDRLLEHRVHQAALDVESLYEERGFTLASVGIEPRSPGADSTAVVVDIDEGRKVAIQQIAFVGNEAFSDGRLRDALETEEKGLWLLFWKDGEFDEAKWRADLARRLPDFYGRHGYLDMRVVSDSVTVDPREGEMRLFVTVDEGPSYTVGEVTIEGNSRFSRADLETLLRLRPGMTFDTEAVRKTIEDIRALYGDDGYIYAQISPDRQVRPDTTVVDLVWRIREGDPAHIRHVAIRGNTVTHESVIRRHIFVTPGERFRQTDVRNSLLALEGLGFFEPGIVPTTRVVDQESGDIDLTFEVVERRTGSLTLGAAVGGGTGLSGFIGYEQPNLFGQGKSGRVRWEFGRRNNNIDLSYTDPVIFGTKTSGSFSFFDIDRRFINTGFEQNAIGGSVRFGTPLPWDDATRLFYGYKWQYIDLESRTSDDTGFEEYPRTESSATLGIVRDTRLPRNHPIQGARHSLSADFAGGPLGGNVGFHKYVFETSWFGQTVNERTVLNLRMKTGGVNATRFVPLTEQFVLGGVQFPAEGLRGYPENCVGVRNAGQPLVGGISCGRDRGNAFVLLTAEHFFKITDSVYASLFYDAGDVFREYRDVTFADLKRGAGIGVQIDLPGFGPLGLDYGYGFDRLDRFGEPDPGWELHFRFGNLLP